MKWNSLLSIYLFTMLFSINLVEWININYCPRLLLPRCPIPPYITTIQYYICIFKKFFWTILNFIDSKQRLPCSKDTWYLMSKMLNHLKIFFWFYDRRSRLHFLWKNEKTFNHLIYCQYLKTELMNHFEMRANDCR